MCKHARLYIYIANVYTISFANTTLSNTLQTLILSSLQTKHFANTHTLNRLLWTYNQNYFRKFSLCQKAHFVNTLYFNTHFTNTKGCSLSLHIHALSFTHYVNTLLSSAFSVNVLNINFAYAIFQSLTSHTLHFPILLYCTQNIITYLYWIHSIFKKFCKRKCNQLDILRICATIIYFEKISDCNHTLSETYCAHTPFQRTHTGKRFL